MGVFLEIVYKRTEIPTLSITSNSLHMLLNKYVAPDGGFLTVLYK